VGTGLKRALAQGYQTKKIHHEINSKKNPDRGRKNQAAETSGFVPMNPFTQIPAKN
jgi:hypothetical protein